MKRSLDRDEERSKSKRPRPAVDIVEENRKLHVLAQRSALGQTLTLFNRLKRAGVANEYSYTILLNAYVRCGSLKSARKVLRQVKELRKTPSVVTYTALLKGYCTGVTERTRQAQGLLEEMERNALEVDLQLKRKKSRELLPNQRTVNTFVRGCLRSGLLEEAKGLVLRSFRVWRLDVGSSSYEYLVMLHCQAKRVANAEVMVDHFRKQCLQDIVEKNQHKISKRAPIPVEVSTAAAQVVSTCFMLYTILGGACAVLGEWAMCRRSLDAAQEVKKFLVSEERLRELLTISQKERNKRVKMKGCSRETITLNDLPVTFASHEGKSNDDRNRKASNSAFRSHLREVHQQHYARVSAFLSQPGCTNDEKSKRVSCVS